MLKVLTQAWDNFFEIQHSQSEDTHELLRKLLEDLQIINEELAEYINSPSWSCPAFYDDDDDEYSIQVSEKSPIAIAPVLPTEGLENSLGVHRCSTTTHADNSLPEYDSFLFEIEPEQGELSSIAMEAILGEPRVYVPNVLPTHPTLYQDLDFTSSDDSFGSGLEDKTTSDFSKNPMMMYRVDIPLLDISVRPIGIKWVFKNKKDERGILIRNKARLVAQGHTQEEGIDYEEFFVPVARIEAIRLFFAYASFMGFTVYQMYVKSAFLYDTIDEEVYVMQPPEFQDPEFPDRVYKVEKAMYGLHQAPRAWYGTLSKYLLANGLQRGTIDQTLFIRKHKGDFLLVQVYVDDIIFGSSNP
nr:putative ribonuclease H-like domain-containing protein [Tanacetum cinerariifolium]